MWDFTKVKWAVKKAMRYDTPGDWEGDEISTYDFGNEISNRAVLLHEFDEAVLCRAKDITPEMIDIIDSFHLEAERGTIPRILLNAYRAIPKDKRDAYERYHILALLIEREFVEAAGGNWQEHDRLMEDSRGKIPIIEGDS